MFIAFEIMRWIFYYVRSNTLLVFKLYRSNFDDQRPGCLHDPSPGLSVWFGSAKWSAARVSTLARRSQWTNVDEIWFSLCLWNSRCGIFAEAPRWVLMKYGEPGLVFPSIPCLLFPIPAARRLFIRKLVWVPDNHQKPPLKMEMCDLYKQTSF